MGINWIVVVLGLLHVLLSCKGKVDPFPVTDANFVKVESHQFG
jgi:hypothetical protein